MFSIRKPIPYFHRLTTKDVKRIALSLAGIFALLGIYSCSTASLAQAEKFYENGEYFEAQKAYREIYKTTKNKEQRGFLNARLGNCYLAINQYSKAQNAFLSALRNAGPDSAVILNLCDALLCQGNVAEAQKYLDIYNVTYIANQHSNILANKIAYSNISNNNTRYKVEEATFTNKRRSNYSPAYAGNDHDILYYTSTDEYSQGEKKSGITGQKFGDIWQVKKDEQGQWGKPEQLQGAVNSQFDEGTPTFTPQGDKIYFSRSEVKKDSESHIAIWWAERLNGEWTEPQQLIIAGDSLNNYGHPAISPDGIFLYFVSDRPGGLGGFDIWRTLLNGNNDIVQNLGEEVNTPHDELFPFCYNDTTLYFASKGHPGYGGLDIYKATFQRNKWMVNNMGVPINSTADDFGMTLLTDSEGFLSSNRKDSRGYDNIYHFVMPDLNCTVSGYIMDTDGYAVADARIRLIGDDGSIAIDKSRTDGSFSLPVLPAVNYAIQASATGFLNANTKFSAQPEEQDAEYIVDFVLVPVNRPVIIDNIYYDFDSATLREESKQALDSLIEMLEMYPNITIKINSHTDKVGTEQYNMRLSDQRALSVVNYLIEKGGIDPNRLTHMGYGKTKPVTVTPRIAAQHPGFEKGIVLTPEFIDTLTDEELHEEADQLNRRTEFEITSVDYFLY